jgi:hypothetical protein
MVILSASSTQVSSDYERINISFNGETLGDPQADTIWGRGYAEGGSAVNPDIQAVKNIGWLPNGNSTEFATMYVYIPNYAATQSTRQAFAKASGARINTGTGTNAYGWSAGLKNSSTAISRVTIGLQAGTSLRAYSYASLYGITKGGSGTVTPS